MNRLLQIGFEPSGHWLLDGDKLTFTLSRHSSQRNILYAFICDGEIKYVGKTIQPLYSRMSGYKNPAPSQSTNVRNNARIREFLVRGIAIDILALPDNGLLHYGQFHVNLAAGLEDSIIALTCPEWNFNRTRREASTPQPETDAKSDEILSQTQDEVMPSQAAAASFTLTVHKTYYKTGFFNVGVDYESLLGRDGQEIEIFCGDADQPILGTINRTANNNGTPRIMGGTGLRDWFHATITEQQQVTVSVITPLAIRIQRRA